MSESTMPYSVYGDSSNWEDAVRYEQNPAYCRDNVIIASGSNEANTTLPRLTLLGEKNTDGKFAPYDPDGTNGSQVAAGILYSPNIDASTATKPAVVLVRGAAMVVFEQLHLVNALTAEQIIVAKQQLLELGIKSV